MQVEQNQIRNDLYDTRQATQNDTQQAEQNTIRIETQKAEEYDNIMSTLIL